MQYQEYAPSQHLRPFIEKFWSLETDAYDIYPMEHLLTPNGTEGLIISYQPVAQKFILNNEPASLPEAYLFIQPYLPWKVITGRCSGVIGVFFRAGSLFTLLKSHMSDIVGQVIELQSFIGSKPVRMLREQLVESLSKERIPLVEQFFTRNFLNHPHHPNIN